MERQVWLCLIAMQCKSGKGVGSSQVHESGSEIDTGAQAHTLGQQVRTCEMRGARKGDRQVETVCEEVTDAARSVCVQTSGT